MLIRPAADGDAPGIAEVHVRSWQACYRGLLPQALLDGLDPAPRVPRWREIVGAGGVHVADDGGVLGFAHAGPTRDPDGDPAAVGELTSVYVHPDRWGLGAGRRLVDAALDGLRAAGRSEATLWVLDTNARATAFYARTGWRPDGAAKDDVIGGQAVRELRYRRAL
ncbi:GNAT family N-acetyltransferase [Actinokineospora soli]|uniref:GNAT family N-acetyltransferase n=1 Tax=Actinokineospora soli TaxID=1048753 RepID=A0ABW2TY59_9PSEU